VRRPPAGHRFDPVDDALAYDGGVDRAKTHVIWLFILTAAGARSAAVFLERGVPRRARTASRPGGRSSPGGPWAPRSRRTRPLGPPRATESPRTRSPCDARTGRDRCHG